MALFYIVLRISLSTGATYRIILVFDVVEIDTYAKPIIELTMNDIPCLIHRE